MSQDTQKLDNSHYVVLQDISKPISYSEDRVQYLKEYLKNYDEKNLHEVELKDTYDMFRFVDHKLSRGEKDLFEMNHRDSYDWHPYLVYKLSDKEYDIIKNDKKFEGFLFRPDDLKKVSQLEKTEYHTDNYTHDHRTNTNVFPNTFIVKNCHRLFDRFSEEDKSGVLSREMAMTTKKLHESTVIPIEEKRQIADFLNSPDNSQVWRSKTLTPEGRIAAAAVLSGTEHGDDLIRELPKMHQDIVATLQRVQSRGKQRGVEACL